MESMVIILFLQLTHQNGIHGYYLLQYMKCYIKKGVETGVSKPAGLPSHSEPDILNNLWGFDPRYLGWYPETTRFNSNRF